jgi:hypothetical protein
MQVMRVGLTDLDIDDLVRQDKDCTRIHVRRTPYDKLQTRAENAQRSTVFYSS